MDEHEIRSAAVGHAIAAYGPVTGDGGTMAEQQKHVISLAVLFRTFIVEGGEEAYRMLGVEMPAAPVLMLVPKERAATE